MSSFQYDVVGTPAVVFRTENLEGNRPVSLLAGRSLTVPSANFIQPPKAEIFAH
jgi:hypothetical protein